MATPASQTLQFTVAEINTHLGGDTTPFQKPFDDALIIAEQNALAENVTKSVICQVIPLGGTLTGANRIATWGKGKTQQYLRPPGDSAQFQPEVDAALDFARKSATNTGKIAMATFQFDPTLS